MRKYKVVDYYTSELIGVIDATDYEQAKVISSHRWPTRTTIITLVVI